MIVAGLFGSIDEHNNEESGEHGPSRFQKASSYAVKSMRCMTFLITFGAYATGFLALLLYAHHVRQYSHHLDFGELLVARLKTDAFYFYSKRLQTHTHKPHANPITTPSPLLELELLVIQKV